jgi:hypothetical protein
MSISLFTWVKRNIYRYFWSPFTPSALTTDATPVSTDSSTDFGRRLIPRIIDERAEEHPESRVYLIPRTANLEDGFDNITWLQLANAINRVSWWIEDNLGRSGTFETIAYFGPTDIGYAIIAVAAQKTGYKVVPSYIKLHCSTYITLGILLVPLEQS